MGKRSGGSSDRILRRHIEAAGKNYSTVEELVDHLRSSYPHLYARHKLHPFTKQVEKVGSTISNDDADSPIVTKRMKINGSSSGGGCSSSSLAYANSSDGETLMDEDSRLVDKSCRKKINENCSSSGKDGTMFKDLGGISEVIKVLTMKVIVPLQFPWLQSYLGGKPIAGILLHGPPGCGKTKLAHAIANEAGMSFHRRCATELVSGVSGESEKNIRELFSEAHRKAPLIVFIDEIDAIASKRDNLQRGMETRIVNQLLASMDESHVPVPVDDDDGGPARRAGYVLVIAATNRPDALDPALRRNGRFDLEIALGLPDEAARIQILSVLIQDLRVEGALDIQKLARSTPGFSGADLTGLAREAAERAKERILRLKLLSKNVELEHSEEEWLRREWSDEEVEKLREWLRQPRWEDAEIENPGEWLKRQWSDEEIENLCISMADFEYAAKVVQPCCTREGFSDIPDVTWDDIGGLHSLRQEFDRYIADRIAESPDQRSGGRLTPATGFLLHGPPGCGKTLVAKAVANAAGVRFIHIKGPEILSKYLGESESRVRTIFNKARTASPCILFFDEVDALTRKHGDEEGGCVERVMKQLLIELDGSEQRRGVYVIGATNRPEVIDDALLRPGRFGRVIHVRLPTPDERGMILQALARDKPIDARVDLIDVGKDPRCHNLSGADLSQLMEEARMAAKKDNSSSSSTEDFTIKYAHFEIALQKASPSVSAEQIQHHEQWSERRKAGGAELRRSCRKSAKRKRKSKVFRQRNTRTRRNAASIKIAYEIIMKDTSGMTPQQLEKHMKFVACLEKKFGI